MPLPRTIEEVIKELDRIIEITLSDNNYLGLFAYIYRRTTAQIKFEVDSGSFDDNPRMQDMDVRFANLYIKAFHDYKAGNQVSKCWQVAFDAAGDELASIQHIMLGMNAHINLDLAIAASEVMEGKEIQDISSDYKAVNDVLASITGEMQEGLARVSPMMFLLDWIGHNSDEKMIDFSITVARERSWIVAQEFWSLNGTTLANRRTEVDQNVANLAERIRRPRTGLLRTVLAVVRYFEVKNVGEIVGLLKG